MNLITVILGPYSVRASNTLVRSSFWDLTLSRPAAILQRRILEDAFQSLQYAEHAVVHLVRNFKMLLKERKKMVKNASRKRTTNGC